MPLEHWTCASQLSVALFYVRFVLDRDKSADIAGDQRCANSGQIVQVVKPRGDDGILALVGSGDY